MIFKCNKHGEIESTSKVPVCRICRSEYRSRVRRNIKKKLIELFGNKCVICGYNKYFGALEFHHLDATKKEIALGGWCNSFEKALKEAKKCILLCSNCHRELEAGISHIPIEYQLPDINYHKENKDKPKTDSRLGPKLHRRKVERPDLEVLKKQIAELGYCGTARLYGITDNGIRKWLKVV